MYDVAAVNRRVMLKGGAAISLAAPFAAIMEAQANAQTDAQGAQVAPVASPYGPISPKRDLSTGLYLLQLPNGFVYRSFSWTGDMMNDGQRVATRHDGMAVVNMVGRGGIDTFLIRNHENGSGQPRLQVGPTGVYDPLTVPGGIPGATPGPLYGGCTVLKVRNGQLVDHRAAIGGTIVNCAGGRSLWNSWLTCEETTFNLTTIPDAGGQFFGKKHGYIFDVNSNPSQTRAVPLVAMGRFSHEAVASDPRTGYIYETEDARNVCLLYRFKPNNTSRTYGSLEDGGKLQALKVVGQDKANFLALSGPRPSSVSQVGQSFDVEWVDIPDPDADPSSVMESGTDNPDTGTRNGSGPWVQGRNAGAARFSRGEGIWWSPKDDCVYMVDTSFGYEASPGGGQTVVRAGRGLGAIWAYHPNREDESKGTLTLVYAAVTRVAGNNPDNITVSPRGGILSCDDGDAVVDQFGPGNRLMGYRNDGLAYIFAKNNVQLSPSDIAKMGRTGQIEPEDYRDTEFAGATFDWSGRILFVNMQVPGITYAISGPWGLGNL